MEVNHVRVATPGLFSKENCVMLDLKSLSRNYSFPLPGGKVISGYGTRGGHSGDDIKTVPAIRFVQLLTGWYVWLNLMVRMAM